MYQDYKDLLSAFHAHGVRYLIVGGYAVIFHAQPRFTKDIDVFIKADMANAQATYAALASFGAPLEGIRPEEFADRGSFFRFGRDPRGFDILLHAEGIDEEFVPTLAGVVGIEEDADRVVAEDVLALGQAGARLAGRRVADEDGVKVPLVVADPGGGFAADGHAVAGLALAEVVDAAEVGARGAAEELLEAWRGVQLGDLNILYLSGLYLSGCRRWWRGLCAQRHNECAQPQGDGRRS